MSSAAGQPPPGLPGLIPHRVQAQQHPMAGGARRSLPLPTGQPGRVTINVGSRRSVSGTGSSNAGGKLMRLRCRFRPLQDAHVVNGMITEESSDVIFLCGDGHQIKAHKVILASCSKFFASIFHGQPVGEISVVNVPDVKVDMMKLILHLTYRDHVILDSKQVKEFGNLLTMFGLSWGQFQYGEYFGEEPQTSVAKSPVPMKPVELPRKIVYLPRPPPQSPQSQGQGLQGRRVVMTINPSERVTLPQNLVNGVSTDGEDQGYPSTQAERHSRKTRLTPRAGTEGEAIVEQEAEEDPENLTRDWLSRLGKKDPSSTTPPGSSGNVGTGVKRMRMDEDLPDQQNICSVCNIRFKTPMAWRWHEQRHVAAHMFKCTFCDHMAKTPKLCYVHEKEVHGYSGLLGNNSQEQQQTQSQPPAAEPETPTLVPQVPLKRNVGRPPHQPRHVPVSQQITKRIKMANLKKYQQAQKKSLASKFSQIGMGDSPGTELLDNKKAKSLHWLYACEQCENCSDSLVKAQLHYQSCHTDSETPFEESVKKYRQGFYGKSHCPLCPRRYPQNSGFLIHCGHQHQQYRRLCSHIIADDQLKCVNCKQIFADPTSFHEHLQADGEGNFACEEEPIEEPNEEPPPPPAPSVNPVGRPPKLQVQRGPGRPPNSGKPRVKRPESPLESKASYKVQFHTPPRSARLANRVQAEAAAEEAAAASKAKSADSFPLVDCPVCGDSDLPNISVHLQAKHKDLNVVVTRISSDLLRCKGCTITFDICDLLDHKNCSQSNQDEEVEDESAEVSTSAAAASRRSSTTSTGKSTVKPMVVDVDSLPPGIGRSPIERIEIDDLHSIDAIRSALKCLICGRTAKKLGVIAECLRAHGVHRCALCFNSYVSKADYGTHLRKCHGSGANNNKLKCPLCPKAFANAGQTSGHMYSTHWLQILKENEQAMANDGGEKKTNAEAEASAEDEQQADSTEENKPVIEEDKQTEEEAGGEEDSSEKLEAPELDKMEVDENVSTEEKTTQEVNGNTSNNSIKEDEDVEVE